MKGIIFYITIIFCFNSCFKSKENKETEDVANEEVIMKKIEDKIENELEGEKEKIILLANVRKIQLDTLNLILRDYFVATDTISRWDDNSKYLYLKAIENVSHTYKISKSKISSLVFSYKYEMLSREEIEEDMIQNNVDISDENDYESENPYF